MKQKKIIREAEEFVDRLFSSEQAARLIYHSFGHTLEVVKNALKIGEKSGLSDEEMEILTLAALFHDSGYTGEYGEHEEKGKEIARDFLNSIEYPEEKTERVLGCIESTKMPQNPKNTVEMALCDADLAHLGSEEFFEYSDLLRTEWKNLDVKNATDAEWLEMSVALLSAHKYFTPYARMKLAEQQNRNLFTAAKLLKKAKKSSEKDAFRNAKLEIERKKIETEKEKISAGRKDERLEIEREKIALKKESSKVAERGIETMFRNTVRTHVEFSAMADSKANIMISINTLIIGIIVATLLRKLVEYPYLTIPTFILMGVSLTCIIFAVFVTRPSVTTGLFTREDIEQKKTNLLFFGNFFKMPLGDFQWGMSRLMNDKEYLYSSMVKDFYFLGQVLGRKYKYLRICYTIFMYGMIITVLAYAIAFVANPMQNIPFWELFQ
jgi:predicted metal-dependent HD superfamily phosphohydrolase